MSQEEKKMQQKLLSQRMTVEQLEKLALMMSRRLRKEAWKIMEQLMKQEQDKRKMTPMEKKVAKQIVKNLQRGPMNRQERRAREEIAPAQKSTETLEKEEVEDDETGENESSDAENQTAESEPETAEREQTEETEVIEAVYGTRKEYMDRLSEQGMAEYMADEYKSHRLLVTDLANTWNLCKWLSEKVDRFGQPVEEE